MGASTIAPLGSYRPSGSTLDRPVWTLAIAFQEILTAIVRLRFNRQSVSSAEAFRAQMRQALAVAEQEAASRGCDSKDIQLAKFAVVAFLDESVLSCNNPIFGDWTRKPLQAELYKHQLAGEYFFDELQKILKRSDSAQTADLLEVYCLCLLLGFKGRASGGDLRALTSQTEEKIHRIQGEHPLSARGGIPPDAVRLGQQDSWLRPLLIVAAGTVLLSAALFIVFTVVLGNAASNIHNLLGQLSDQGGRWASIC